MSRRNFQPSATAPQNMSAEKKLSRRDQAIINKIVVQFTSRVRIDIQSWRKAIEESENDRYPKRTKWSKVVKDLDLDAHWTSQTLIRRLSVMRIPFKVVNKKTRIEIHEKTELFQAPWFYYMMATALDAKFIGTQLMEIETLIQGNYKKDALFKIPQAHVVPEKKMIMLKETDNFGLSYSEDPYMLEFEEETHLGLLCKAAPHIIWKKNAQQSWAEFCEKFGIPMRTATTNKKDTATIARLEEALVKLGSAASAVLPEGTTLGITDANTRDAFDVFDKKIERCNSEISKLINTVTMISDSGSSLSQSQVHMQMFQKVIDSDAADFHAQMKWDILPKLAAVGFPFDPATEEWCWDFSEKITLGALWNIVQGILKFYEVDEKWLIEKFGVPVGGARRAVPIQDNNGGGNIPNNAAELEAVIMKLCDGHVPDTVEGMSELVMKILDPEGGKVKSDFNGGHSHPAVDGLYPHVCGQPDNALKDNIYSRLFDKLINEVFKNAPPEIPLDVYQEQARQLTNAFQESSTRWDNIDFDSPDNLRVFMYQANLFRFSAAATFKDVIQLNNLARQSKDFNEFKKLAADYKGIKLNHLQTEYNHTVAVSQNAANWLRAWDERKDYDLQYQTVGDARVRDSHRSLDGTVAPVESNIWNSIYPPNGWGCRCEVIQIPRGSRTHTDSSKVDTSAVQKGFNRNWGKLDHVFDAAHEYFKEFPDEAHLNTRKYGIGDLSLSSEKLKYKNDGQADFEKWWNGQPVQNDDGDIFYKSFQGLNHRLSHADLFRKFANYPKEENRWGIAEHVADMLAKPDEVWLNRDKGNLRAVYLKAYDDGVYATIAHVTDNALDVVTWYKLFETQMGNHRNGLLLRKAR